jgi:hypothetical protein
MKQTLLLAAMLLPLAGHADEPVPKVTISAPLDSEWGSYRRAYKANAYFATFTRSRPLIQAHMQIRPLRPGLPLDGLQVRLAGETTSADIAVDAIGRAVLPMLKKAYDEDAVLRLNRQKGHYAFSGRYSIKEREDGRYTGADLRAACEQLIDAQRESGYRLRLFGKRCAAVAFIYPADADNAAIDVDAAGVHHTVGAIDAHPFEDGSMGLYKVVYYRFADWNEQSAVLAQQRPLAIGTLYQ